mmetsp:Transcript_11087/g.27185  ORF Transcript_11087/g.27185 Transcript_11087/m.27185 type:complete len:622 (+) Transcript_11087:59-1924(+)
MPNTTPARFLSSFAARRAAVARRANVAVSLQRKRAAKAGKAPSKPSRKGVVVFRKLSEKLAVQSQHEVEQMYAPEGEEVEFERVFDPPSQQEIKAQEKAAAIEPLNFDDASEALRSKTTFELARAYTVLQLCGVPAIVKNGRSMYAASSKILGQTITDRLVGVSFFGHFCGGVSSEELGPVLTKMKSLGVGSILDYAAENDVAERSDRHYKVVSARTYDYQSEAVCEHNAKSVMHAIDNAAISAKQDGKLGFAAMKVTAFGKPELLERMTEVLASVNIAFSKLDTTGSGWLTKDQIRTGFKEMGVRLTPQEMDKLIERMDFNKDNCIDATEFIDSLSPLEPDTAPLFITEMNPLHKDGLDALEADEISQLKSMLERLGRVAAHAANSNVSLMIDAEQSYMQPAIDQVALGLMRKYNKDRAVILNTYQCYLRDAFQRVRADVDRSEFYGFVFGAKIVRGAYMVQERRLAEEKGYPDPIQPDLEATHKNYDTIASYIIAHKASGKEGMYGPDSSKRRSSTVLMVATHNENSVKNVIQQMHEKGLEKDSGVCFGQLRGMCDHVSLTLGAHGYRVYKYVPYGPIREVMPYLLRRAEENSTLMAGASKERSLVWSELSRRLMGRSG